MYLDIFLHAILQAGSQLLFSYPVHMTQRENREITDVKYHLKNKTDADHRVVKINNCSWLTKKHTK